MSFSSRDIFLRGYSFQSAGEHLRRNDNPNLAHHGYPAIHLSFLASEMYLKALRHSIDGVAPRGHRLSLLYSNLPKSERHAINDLWLKYFRLPQMALFFRTIGEPLPGDPSLRHFLEKGDFMFESSRYTWEPAKQQNSIFILTDLPALLYVYIVQRHPDWAPAFEASKAPEERRS